MKTVIEMAREAAQAPDRTDKSVLFFGLNGEQMFRFAALVRADERSSWPAEMEAMERQVNILTDALAQAKVDEREACAALVFHSPPSDEYESPLRAVYNAIRARSNT